MPNPDVKAERAPLPVDALFEFIKHGDENHRAWLLAALRAFAAGLPRPDERPITRAPPSTVAAEMATEEDIDDARKLAASHTRLADKLLGGPGP